MFDYLIVGGGTAGCVLAARLTEDPDTTVALLEAGPADHSVFIRCPAGVAVLANTGVASWRINSEPQTGLNGRTIDLLGGRVLGGSSAINNMAYTRGHRDDYDQWAADGNPGWAYDDVLPYFKKAEHNERGADAHHGTGGPLNVKDLTHPHPLSGAFVQAAQQAGLAANPDFNGTTPTGVGVYQVSQKNGARCSTASAYLTPHLRRPNLQVLTGAHATRILLERKRAVGVEFEQGGHLKQLRCAREVLLCAGALHSPQILMLSGIGPHAHLLKMGIATTHNLPGVGEDLHDQPDVAQVVSGPRVTTLGLSLHGLLQGAWAAMAWHRHRTGPLTSNLTEAGGFVKSQPGERLADLQLHFVVSKLPGPGGAWVPGYGYACHASLLRPISRGRVMLASKDPRDAPRIDPDFLSARADVDRLVHGFKLVRHILAQPALQALGGTQSAVAAKAQSDFAIEQFIREHGGTRHQPAGTCRMGKGALDVVDAQLRVHGMAGLRVVDASIMPSPVGGNTTAPVVMVAEKAADLIKLAPT